MGVCLSIGLTDGQTPLRHAKWAARSLGKYIFIDCLCNCNTCCFLTERLPPPPGECTFDQDECAFTQEKRNRSSWHRGRGETPTSYTGPKGDHTTGVGELCHMVLFPKNITSHTSGHLLHFERSDLCLVSRMTCMAFFTHKIF